MQELKLMPIRVNITAILRKEILSGEFPAGTELSLTDIAAKLGVSRTPVREAFQTLASEGLIELRLNKSAIVSAIDEAFIRDHFSVRILVESEAAARAAQAGMDTSGIRALHKRFSAELAEGDSSGYTNYNERFHSAIWAASGSAKLHRLCETFWHGPSYTRAKHGHMQQAFILEHQRLSTEEHGEILDCIEKGDAQGAREAIEKHLYRSMDNMLKSFSHQDDTGA